MNNIEFKEFPKIYRLSREIIVTEKLDGTNSQIYIGENGEFLTGSRNRWITPEDDNYGFSKWAHDNKDELLKLGVGSHFGEWWGCLSAETSITLSDGSLDKIGRIVNSKLPLNVKSYNFKSNKIESKKIIGWKKASKTSDWLTIRVKRKKRGGHEVGLHLTPNHIVFRKSKNGTPEECNAENLKIGDLLYMNSEKTGYIQEQLIRGSLLGDGYSQDYCFSCRHSNKKYFLSKKRILENIITSVGTGISGHGSLMHIINVKSLPLLRDLEPLLYRKGKKYIDVDYVRKLHPCGLAFWYMDDGSLQTTKGKSPVCSIYTNGFKLNDIKLVSEYMNNNGYENYIVFNDKKPILKFTPNGTIAFHFTIAPYITPEMSYKIIPQCKTIISDLYKSEIIKQENTSLAESEIVSIDNTYSKGNRSKYRYDIEVEGNHNFFANGLLVHNSGIQRRYNMDRKIFSLFNTTRWLIDKPACCEVVPILYQGIFSEQKISDCLEDLKINGSKASTGFMKPEGVVIFHLPSRFLFKKTIEKDEEPKGLNK